MPQTKASGTRKPDPASKSSQARVLLETGMSVTEIARTIGSTTGLVYNLKWKMGLTSKRKPDRPRKVTAAGSDGSSGIVAALQNCQRELAVLLAALERIRGILAEELD